MKITIFPSMQLGGAPPQLTDQVKDRIVDMVWTLPGYNAGRFPKTEVFELPFVHTNTVATTLALQDYQEKHLQDEYKDFKVLLLHVHAGNIIMSKKPILKFSDMKGLKVRGATRTGTWYLKAIGSNPVGAPVPAVPQMLAKGVIDATNLPYEIAPAYKLQDLVSNFSQMAGRQPRLSTSVFSMLMNKKSYDGLSTEMKRLIDANSGRNIARLAAVNWSYIEGPARKLMASRKKNKFHTIPLDEVAKFRAAAAPVYARWISEMDKKGFDGKALLAEARELVNKYTK